MKNTVVIFNAGIGALTLGFQNAGYDISREQYELLQESI